MKPRWTQIIEQLKLHLFYYKKQSVVLAALVIAWSVLLGRHFLGKAPQPVQAENPPSVQIDRPTSATPGTIAPEPVTTPPVILVNWSELHSDRSRNPFEADWMDETPVSIDHPIGQPTDSADRVQRVPNGNDNQSSDPQLQINEDLTLTALEINQDKNPNKKNAAMINGDWYEVGDIVSGYRLVRIIDQDTVLMKDLKTEKESQLKMKKRSHPQP